MKPLSQAGICGLRPIRGGPVPHAVSDWLRPLDGLNICLLLNHMETFRVTEIYFFSIPRTAGCTGATKDFYQSHCQGIGSHVRSDWLHCRAPLLHGLLAVHHLFSDLGLLFHHIL